MDTDRFLRISDIFHEALDLSPEERSKLLDDACGDDVELRREVEGLLAEEEEPSLPDMQQRSLLDTKPFGTVDAEHTIGQQLGPYKVVRCLGEGGMGRVYLAERTADFEQLVAIKIARPGRLDEISLARFRDEIKFLAALSQHSQIAGILDAGTTPDGRPYLVMEYVDGLQIDEYCNKRSLSLVDRLQLFQSVCRAVEFAHQHALIHRDIKPSNILVTANGTATLIDFGIAKLQQPNERTASISATQTIYRALTPHYASPEQIRGELQTISSDVYSLGVVLYELLTGARPFDLTTTSAAEMERIVCEQDPESPSQRVRTLTPHTFQDLETNDQWRRKVSGDLDNIVMMCLRKEPDRRYQSVRDLSDDIERHLTNLPVSARQITSLDRTWRWCKRNPLVTMLSTALILSLIAGLFGVGAQWRRAEHNAAHAQAAATLANNAAEAEREERMKAQKAETLAAKSAAEAAASAEEAKRQAESAQEVTDFLIGIFQGADPLGVRGYQFGPPPDESTNPTARELLERGLKMIETELQNEPQIQATIKRAIAETYVSLGDLQQAELLASSALEIQRSLYGATPQVKTAETLTTIATIRYFQGNYEAAIPPYRESVEMLDRLYGEMDPRGATNKLFFAFIVLESNLNGEGNSEGERLINQVFEIRKAQPNPPPQDLALALIGKAIISRVRKRPKEAKAALMQAGLVLAGDPTTGAVYGKLALTAVSATLNWQFGRTAAAADETQEVIKSMKAALGQYHPVVTHLQLDLSRRMIAADPKRPERGLKLMQEAVNSCQVAYGRQPRTALALKLHGEQLLKVDAIQAEKHLRESVDIYVEILGDENVRTQRAVKLHAQALAKIRGEESSD